MRIVYISNFQVQETEEQDIVFDNKLSIEQLPSVEKLGNSLFAIDVHCTFTHKGRQLKLQEQGGVIIYRNLLSQFKDCQDKLKVVFYSPISKEHLAALRPENYVLTLLPFVQCEYDGSFETKLKTEIQEYSFNKVPVFNNASENLLSGWSLFKADKNRKENDFVETQYKFRTPDEKPRKIRFIDDQINEWKKTYTEIFEPKSDLKFLEYKKSNTPLGKFDENKIDNLNNHVMQASLIVSDFYLEEKHESNNWLSSEQLTQKSGFQLYQKIKGTKDDEGIHKAVPYVMHTSSNKIQYYKFLDANGVDNWLVKDTRTDSTTQEKKENFYAFKKVIEEFTYENSSAMYGTLKKIWDRITELEEIKYNRESTWWYSPTEYTAEEIPVKNGVDKCKKATDENVDEIFGLFKDSWMAIRANMNRESLFAANIGSNDKSFTAAAVCSNLGKLFELFGFTQGMHLNTYFKYLFCVRNIGSHYKDYKHLELNDALIYFDCWLTAFERKELNVADVFKTMFSEEEFILQGKTHRVEDSFNYRLLFVYIQFINGFHLSEKTIAHKLINERIEELLRQSNKNVLCFEIETNFYDQTNNKKFIKLKSRADGREIDNFNRVASNWKTGGNNFKIITERDSRYYITNNA